MRVLLAPKQTPHRAPGTRLPGLTRHSRTLHPVVTHVLGLVLLLVAPSHASPTQAMKLKRAADQAFVDGDYALALKRLRAAYAADPQPGFIANEGLVLEQMAEYRGAAEAFERFLATKPTAEKARAALKVLARIKPEVEVVTDPPGAEVRLVDGSARSLGKTPLRTRLVAGTYTMSLRLAGHAPAEIAIRVWPGRALSVRQALARESNVMADQVRPIDPKKKRRGGTKWGWVLLGGAAVAGGAAGAFYVLGDDAVSARDGARSGASWDEHQSDAELWNTSYLTAAGLAGAALVGGVVLLLSGGGEATAVVRPGGLGVLATF